MSISRQQIFMTKQIFRNAFLVLNATALAVSFAPVTTQAATLPFKYLSSTNECYAPSSREYIAITKNFDSFTTLEECQKMIKKPELPKEENNQNNSNTNPTPTQENKPEPKKEDAPATPNNSNGFNNGVTTMFTLNGNGGGSATPRCISVTNNFANIPGCCSFPFAAANTSNNNIAACLI